MFRTLQRSFCVSALFVVMCGPAAAQGQLEHPLIFFNAGAPATQYDAATDSFSVASVPLALQLTSGAAPIMIGAPAALTILIEVDDGGNLVGGSSGPDLQITGDGSVLLEGEVTAFTVIGGSGSTDIYGLSFDVTGGSLAGDFAGATADVELTSEQSDFDGSFADDFSGGAKGTVGRVTAPTDCNLALDKTCLVVASASADLGCTAKIVATRLRYIGPAIGGISSVELIGSSDASASYDVELMTDQTVLAGQNGFSIDATASGESDLGSKMSIFVNGVEEEIHTSCSAPFVAGQPAPLDDPKGDPSPNWLVEAFIDRDGNDVTLPNPEYADSCEIPAPGDALCEDRPTAIQFRYTGGDCADSSNGQADDKFDCTDFGTAAGPVDVLVFNDGDVYANAIDLLPGDTIDATAASAGQDDFDSEVEAEIRDAAGNLLQTIRLHTSCSQPLALGDRFGGLEVVSFTNDEQGTVNSGSQVLYRYTVSNGGPGTVTDIVVTDTSLDPVEVPGSPIASLAAGTSTILEASVFVDAPTDGVAMLQGTVGGAVCEASDSTPITVAVPPPCDVADAGFELKDDALKWTLSNNGSSAATIQSIELAWPGEFGALREIKLAGNRIFDEELAPPAALIDSFAGASEDRRLEAGQTDTLEIKFRSKYKEAQPGDIQVTIVFAEGCQIVFEPGNNPFGDCNGKIAELTMIWDGMVEPVNIRTYAGEPGSDLVFASGDLFIGDEVTAGDFTAAGAPNDVFWEIFDSAGNLLGESKFHRSCSDDEMDGPEDCGAPQGNGKNNDAGFVNDWLLEGLRDEDGTLDCSEL